MKSPRNGLSDMNFEVFPFPPYSPDMAPAGFNLFRSLQHFLSGVEEVKISLNDLFSSKNVLSRAKWDKLTFNAESRV